MHKGRQFLEKLYRISFLQSTKRKKAIHVVLKAEKLLKYKSKIIYVCSSTNTQKQFKAKSMSYFVVKLYPQWMAKHHESRSEHWLYNMKRLLHKALTSFVKYKSLCIKVLIEFVLPSIYSLLSLHPVQGLMGLEPIVAAIMWQAEYTPNGSLTHNRANKETCTLTPATNLQWTGITLTSCYIIY